jgi:hypothetical protein
MFEDNVKTESPNEAAVGAQSSGTGVSAGKSSTGQVTHDARGTAIWQWGVATGVFARIKTTELLSMLDNPALALEGECPLAAGEWSGDPYNRR